MKSTQRLRPFAIPALVLLPCLLLYFLVFMPQGLVSWGRSSLLMSFDFHSYFLPRLTFGSTELFQGRLPTWNPFEYAGLPFLATAQPEVFYPPKILLFGILPPVAAYWGYVVLHMVAGAAAMLAFLHERRFTVVGATVGVLLWTFAAAALNSNYHPIRFALFVWVPVALLLADRVARGVPNSFAWLAVVAAMSLLAGYPEWVFDLGLLLAVHAVVCWANREWPAPPWRTVPVLGAAFLLGGLVAAVQLFPLAELSVAAHRTDVATGVVNAARSNPLGGSMSEHFVFAVAGAFLRDSVPGLLVFALAGALLPRARAALAGFLFCGFMAKWGWLALRALPGMSMVRFPWSWWFLPPVFVAWLGAAGADAFAARFLRSPASEGANTEHEGASPSPRWTRPFVAVLGLGFAAFYVFEWFHLRHRPPGEAATLWTGIVGDARGAALGALGSLLLAAAALSGSRRWLVPTTLVASAVLTIAYIAPYPLGGVPAPVDRPFPEGEIARLHGRPDRIKGRVLSPDDILYGNEFFDRLPSVLGAEESFLPWRHRRLLQHLAFVPMFGWIDYTKVSEARGLLSALDMQFFSAPYWFTQYLDEQGFRHVRHGGNLVLFENPRRMGHAWVNYAVQVARSETAAEAAVFAPSFDPHRVVVLEAPPAGTYETDPLEAPVATRPSYERHPSPTESEYVVEIDRPGVFVVSETAYPGWYATVDGAPARWVTADYLLRAVELPTGIHKIRFEYRPASIRWGFLTSGVGVLVVLALFSGRRLRGTSPG